MQLNDVSAMNSVAVVGDGKRDYAERWTEVGVALSGPVRGDTRCGGLSGNGGGLGITVDCSDHGIRRCSISSFPIYAAQAIGLQQSGADPEICVNARQWRELWANAYSARANKHVCRRETKNNKAVTSREPARGLDRPRLKISFRGEKNGEF